MINHARVWLPTNWALLLLVYLSRASMLYALRIYLLRFACFLCFALRASLFAYINSLRCLIAINRYIDIMNIRFADISIMYILYCLYLFLYFDTFVTRYICITFFFAVARVASLHVPAHPPAHARARARPRSCLAVRALSLRFAPLPLRSQLRQRSGDTAPREFLKKKWCTLPLRVLVGATLPTRALRDSVRVYFYKHGACRAVSVLHGLQLCFVFSLCAVY